MKSFRSFVAASILCAGISANFPLCAQTAQGTPAPATAAEVASKDAPVTFKSGVNLIPVPVVVRDSKGRAVGELGVNDFQLFDNGKPQMISKFTVQKLTPGNGAVTLPVVTSPNGAPAGGGVRADGEPDGIPDRFVAYLFDDLHMSLSDLVYTRDAARREIDSSLHALDRAAIYTTSGRQTMEFTGDREKLHAALAAIATGPAQAQKALAQNSCPPMTYYMGDRINNLNDTEALNVAAADAMVCANLHNLAMAQQMARQAAREAASLGDRDTVSALDTLRTVINRMATMPGQRSIVLVSPGFLVVTTDRQDEETRLIERAVKANVVIGALDARGLYTMIPGGDASQRTLNTATINAKSRYATAEANAQADVMANLSSGTGGTFYRNSNDLDEGFARTAAAPDYLYILGFSPLGLKLDGRYHDLKVVVTRGKGLVPQARKGYYAPRYAQDAADLAKQQLEEAFFTRDELHDLPAMLHTEYFKSDNGDATLLAVTKIDVKKLAFHREADRNRNDVTVLTGLFDNDGNYVSGQQKTMEFRLLDSTLEKPLTDGMAVRSTFTVHPGRYVVRMVVRDSEGQLMAAESALVEIR